MIVQIYGITTVEDAALVDGSGADHAGLVLDEGLDAWDSVEEGTMNEIRRALGHVTVVGLSLSTERDRILRTVDVVRPAILHLAHAAEAMTVDEIAALRLELDPIRMMVTIPVRGPEAVETARLLTPVADFFLLDTANPATGIVGATGLVHDWSLSRRVVEAVDVPVILAGGLGPDNVLDAIRQVGPAGVDSETRTSRDDDRRRKDPDKLRRFIELCRVRSTGAGERDKERDG